MSDSPAKDAPRASRERSPPPGTESKHEREEPAEAVSTEEKQEREREREHRDTSSTSREKSEDSSREERQTEDQEEEKQDGEEDAPPLADEIPPPLPSEAPPGQGQGRGQGEDDGWEPVWDANAQAYYFYNRFTGVSQWENPRVPEVSAAVGTADTGPGADEETSAEVTAPAVGGYNPAIHGDYDPTAPYAQQYERQDEATSAAGGGVNPANYEAAGAFNRFTGRWQATSQNPEYHNDENKSRRQMYAYFDVDAAANSHDGRSLRAERSAKKLSKKELKMFKEKRREKKEEKRRAWLRD